MGKNDKRKQVLDFINTVYMYSIPIQGCKLVNKNLAFLKTMEPR